MSAPREYHRHMEKIPGWTKRRRLAFERAMMNMLWLDREGPIPEKMKGAIPDAWRTLEDDVDVEEPKTKVTLYVDKSVAKFYRAMGRGYQARMNRVLSSWAQFKIAEALEEWALSSENDRIFEEARALVKKWKAEGHVPDDIPIVSALEQVRGKKVRDW